MSQAVSRRTQSERKVESEQKLFDALTRLINREGIAAVTCESIGVEAGLSRGMANQRLGKRQEMFENLVERLGIEQVQTLAELEIDKLCGSDALLSYIDVHFDAILSNPGYQAYFVLVAGSVADAPLLKHCITEAHEFVHQLLTQFITKGQQENLLNRNLDAESHAAMIGSYLLGVAIQAKFTEADKIKKLKAGAIALVNQLVIR